MERLLVPNSNNDYIVSEAESCTCTIKVYVQEKQLNANRVLAISRLVNQSNQNQCST